MLSGGSAASTVLRGSHLVPLCLSLVYPSVRCVCIIVVVWRWFFLFFFSLLSLPGLDSVLPVFSVFHCPRPWVCSGRLCSIRTDRMTFSPESLVSCYSEDSGWLVSSLLSAMSSDCSKGDLSKTEKSFPTTCDTVRWVTLGDNGISSPREFSKLKGQCLNKEEIGPSKKKKKSQNQRMWERRLRRLALFYDCLEHPCENGVVLKPNPHPLLLSSACPHHLLCTPVSSFTQDTESFCMCITQSRACLPPRTPAVLWVPCTIHFPDGTGRKAQCLNSARLWATALIHLLFGGLDEVGQCLHFKYLTVALVLIMKHLLLAKHPFCNLDMALSETNIVLYVSYTSN